MNDKRSVIGQQLYRLLPEVYRTRDSADDGLGDLEDYLDACGQLLDRMSRTLEQRLADSFPGGQDGIGPAQTWILPYLAELFDARLVAPSPAGRADEVAQAIRWRQRKGTLAAVEQIAQAIARTEVEVQEGWKRILRTPRVGQSLLPPLAFGVSREFNQASPVDAAKRPGLPLASVDFRCHSRAVTESNQAHPLGKVSRFAGEPRFWVQAHRHGVPCYPGSYEDVSQRTVDLRTADRRQGHIHPRRVLLFAPPPLGFFQVGWETAAHTSDNLTLDQDQAHVVEDRIINDTLTVSSGRLTLRRCAVRHLVVQTPDGSQGSVPSVVAEDCLFDTVHAQQSARLEYCTVLTSITARRLQASDCIIAGEVNFIDLAAESLGCIRFSRIAPLPDAENLREFENTNERTLFLHLPICEDEQLVLHEAQFGEPGCGVLHPGTSDAICFGAEDGGEMGACHREHHCLGRAAVLEKLRDFLPLGMEAVWILDPRLLEPPPRTPETT